MADALFAIHDPVDRSVEITRLTSNDTLSLEADDGEGNMRVVVSIEVVSVLSRTAYLHIQYVGIEQPEGDEAYLFVGDSIDFGAIEDEAPRHFATVELREVRE